MQLPVGFGFSVEVGEGGRGPWIVWMWLGSVGPGGGCCSATQVSCFKLVSVSHRFYLSLVKYKILSTVFCVV